MNVALDAAAASVRLEALLDRLVRELPSEPERTVVFLPPLVANLAAFGRAPGHLELGAAARRAERSRPIRAAMVRLAYPAAAPSRRPWLTSHDRVHQVLRRTLGGLAARLDATVIAGTALLAHPRVHWEDWPDSQSVFHTAWAFGPDTEPRSVVRHPSPDWAVLTSARVDKTPALDAALMGTDAGAITIAWDDRRLPAPDTEIVWAPRAWLADDRGADVPAAVRPAALLRGDARVVVRTCLSGCLGGPLVGRSLIAARQPDGTISTDYVPEPDEGIAWTALRVRDGRRG